MHTLGEVARSQPGERVLCHGDLIGDNLLADRDGRLWVVDWDAAALAPRERELALFAGQGFERFLDHYERAAGSCALDPDLVAFFLLRRNLDDLVDWLGGVLSTDRPDQQRRAGPGRGAVVRVALGRADGTDPAHPPGAGAAARTRHSRR